MSRPFTKVLRNLPSNEERISDPFYTTRINVGGTGLGLSLVHSIVEDHEGKVEVESEVGVGTRFSVSLQIRD